MTREKWIEWSVLTACLVLGFAASCLSGCATVLTKFEEKSYDDNGNEVTTTYSGKAIMPLGGKLDPSSHQMAITVKPDGSYTLDVGQTSEGGSVEGMGAALQGMQGMLDFLSSSMTPAP